MTTSPPSGSSPDPSRDRRAWIGRLRRRAPEVLLVLGLLLQVVLHVRWIRLDGRVGASVFCEMLAPVVERMAALNAGQLGAWFAFGHPLSFFDLAALAGRSIFGSHPDFLLYTVLVFAVGAQLVAFDLGRLLAGPWAGVLAALTLPLYPDPGAMVHRWAPEVPQMFLLLAAADLLIRSHSLSRPLPALGFAFLVSLGAGFSNMTTHDLLFLLAAGGLAAGAVGRGLLLGLGPLDAVPVSRARVTFGALLVASLVAIAAWYLQFGYVGLAYYQGEWRSEAYGDGGGWWHVGALSAYPRYLFWFGLGPWLAVVALLGLGLTVWRGKGRAELLGWLLIPLVLLSLTAKKNWYYISVIYPVAPLVTAMGLAALPWRRVRHGLMAVVLIGTWALWQRASFGNHDGRSPARLASLEQVFQTIQPPNLAPLPRFARMREAFLLRENLPDDSCPGGLRICMEPYAQDILGAILILEAEGFCLQHEEHAPIARCDWVLWTDGSQPGPGGPPGPTPAGQPADPPPRLAGLMAEHGLVPVAQDTMQEPVIWLLRNPRPERPRRNPSGSLPPHPWR